MEAKLNIAEILKDKPKGTKLYADAFGELCTEDICTEDELGITLSSKDDDELLFYNDGKYNRYGEPILFPSKEMRDWSKFAWKKGDVLVSKGRRTLHAIFEGFNDDTYTTFKGKHYICDYLNREDYNDEKYYNDYHKEVNERTIEFEKDNVNKAQNYIDIIEKKLGGKLNLETLEIENAHPEFKDGDIVTQGVLEGVNVYIIKNCTDKVDNKYNYYARYNSQKKKINYDDWSHISPFAKFATDSEKQQLFDALAKEGKAWDAEKKQIVNLKPKWTPKPFDRVITRVDDDAIWTANIFSHIDQYGEYVTIGCESGYPYCLPYNEETAKLIGTTKDVED